MEFTSAEHFYWIWLWCQLLGVTIFTYFLLKQYSSNTKLLSTVKALTFFGWFLGIATISVLPIDISLSNYSQSKSADEKPESMEYVLRIFWRCFYWTA